MKSRLIWIVGAVVAVAALLAVLTTGSQPDQAYGTVAVEGSALPTFQDPSADPAVGMAAPAITGETVSVVPGGTPTLVLFLAHWCPHCQREVPRIVDWVAENGAPAGIQVIGVATSTEPTAGNFPPSAWLDREGWSFPLIYDDESSTAGHAYGVSSFPFWVVIDSSGRVAGRFSGELEPGALGDLFTEIAGL